MYTTTTATHQARVGSWPKRQGSIAEVTAALKQRYKEERQLLAMRQRQTALQQRPATKRDAKPSKLTANTPSSFNAAALRVCPGATRNQTTSGLNRSIMLMAEAEGTGCRVATKSEQRRLGNSALNCNTTQGNYTTTHLAKAVQDGRSR